MKQFIKYPRKPEVPFEGHVIMLCDHRDRCSTQPCHCQSKADHPGITREDIAYRDAHHCQRFRPIDGGSAGADIIESGIWPK